MTLTLTVDAAERLGVAETLTGERRGDIASRLLSQGLRRFQVRDMQRGAAEAGEDVAA